MKRILTAICLITLCAILLVSCDSAPSTSDDHQNGNNNYYDNENNNYYDNENNQQSSTSKLETTTNTNDDNSDDEPASEAPSTEKSTCYYHDWKSATCTTPRTCAECGATDGEANGHDYRDYGDAKCYNCDMIDPKVTELLNTCSLELPTLPEEISYYGYNNTLYSSVSVTKIVPIFEYEGEGTISLTIKISGTKTYDYQGSNQSSACKIGWKLYDQDGNVFRSDTFYSSNIAVGESFANKEEDLIFNFDDAEPGAYKLVLLDVN